MIGISIGVNYNSATVCANEKKLKVPFRFNGNQANKGGRTTFIEQSDEWIKICKRKWPSLEVYKASYSTKRSEWSEILRSAREGNFERCDSAWSTFAYDKYGDAKKHLEWFADVPTAYMTVNKYLLSI